MHRKRKTEICHNKKNVGGNQSQRKTGIHRNNRSVGGNRSQGKTKRDYASRGNLSGLAKLAQQAQHLLQKLNCMH